MKSAVFLLLLAFAGVAFADHWAVIVAGSSGFWNYRHQADACHAYQIVKKNGIPESNIILLMADDVAHASENPFPGKLFNKPTADGTPGVDVYEGCNPDYRGSNVTAEKFLQVLQGNKTAAGGKVLESKGTDHVFVNFVDHGGPGLIAFPNGPYLYKDQLQKAIEFMHTNSMYQKLVFYMEACNSGSMWEGFPTDLNAFITTAANPNEPSWGTYCPPNDKVNGKEVGSCLGDLYSVNWMEDSDLGHEDTETLEAQFNKVKTETNKSHVMQYGETDWADKDDIGEYQGTAKMMKALETTAPVEKDSIDSRDVALVTKFYRYIRSDRDSPDRVQLFENLQAELTQRHRFDMSFKKIEDELFGGNAPHVPPTNFHCLRKLVSSIRERCGDFSDYGMKYLHVLVAGCEANLDYNFVVNTIQDACI
jgi:legumain